jgi:hypothetical protein
MVVIVGQRKDDVFLKSNFELGIINIYHANRK